MNSTANRTVYIYALKDPRENAVHYVGKTTNPKQRFEQHIANCVGGRSPKDTWIHSLLLLGMRPQLVVIETATENEWSDRERFWIAFYNAEGYLTNATAGGEAGWTNRKSPSRSGASLTARRLTKNRYKRTEERATSKIANKAQPEKQLQRDYNQVLQKANASKLPIAAPQLADSILQINTEEHREGVAIGNPKAWWRIMGFVTPLVLVSAFGIAGLILATVLLLVVLLYRIVL